MNFLGVKHFQNQHIQNKKQSQNKVSSAKTVKTIKMSHH